MNALDQPQSYTVTHRRVLAIAVPMTLSSATTPLLGVVATAVIGRLGEAHLLGAVAMSSVVFDCLFWLFAFLRMGTVALTAQALGAGDVAEERATLVRALLVAAAIGLALILLQVPLAAVIYRLMGASPEVTRAAEIYFHVRIWSAPFALANYVLLGWFVGLARARTALLLQVALNVIDAAVIALLVLVFDFGVAGAAFGAVVAEAAGAIAGIAIALRIVGARMPDLAQVFDRARLVRMFVVNRDILIRTALLIVAWAFFAAQGARSGDVVLAANSVLHNLVLVGAFFLDGFASAAEQLCGRATGARDGHAFSRAVRLSLSWGFGFGAAATLTLVAIGPWLIDLMTASPEVRIVARDYLVYAALASVIGVFAFTYDGIYIGATWTRDMRNLMIVSLALYFAAWWLTRPLGNGGLWIAILMFFGARGALQAARYPALARATFKT
ncbi:MAG: multidrug resistance protein family [Hyphomicrobiales bacterium]|jgi:MATE family multidrug resistance protein|nr:multidrug resistance protein family [Hyphomicrobiales bacterium]